MEVIADNELDMEKATWDARKRFRQTLLDVVAGSLMLAFFALAFWIMFAIAIAEAPIDPVMPY